MKKLAVIVVVIGLLAAGGSIYALVRHFASQYVSGSHAADPTIAGCQTKGPDHAVTVQYNTVVPQHTQAALCDTLTITNADNQVRLLAFGMHDHHQAYDGVTEKSLDKNQRVTVTLDQVGTFEFHDHLQDEVQGSFTVTN